MKVKYSPVLTHDERTTLEPISWLTIDAEYHVVSPLAHAGRRVDLQRLTDNGHSLAWFDSTAFITVDGSVPESWEARIHEGVMPVFATAT